jgi:hypothetical protein
MSIGDMSMHRLITHRLLLSLLVTVPPTTSFVSSCAVLYRRVSIVDIPTYRIALPRQLVLSLIVRGRTDLSYYRGIMSLRHVNHAPLVTYRLLLSWLVTVPPSSCIVFVPYCTDLCQSRHVNHVPSSYVQTRTVKLPTDLCYLDYLPRKLVVQYLVPYCTDLYNLRHVNHAVPICAILISYRTNLFDLIVWTVPTSFLCLSCIVRHSLALRIHLNYFDKSTYRLVPA